MHIIILILIILAVAYVLLDKRLDFNKRMPKSRIARFFIQAGLITFAWAAIMVATAMLPDSITGKHVELEQPEACMRIDGRVQCDE